ncbi:MAG: ribosome maturation factor [Flavipsychrobacter sp.]|nr:ribosome maturation factor [Flavipsychrobacter sp.]
MADILSTVETLLLPLLEDTDIFICSVKMKPVNNIKVFLDADGGLPIEKIAKLNRRLNALIEEAQLFPEGDYSLEVSSPGIDEPLAQLRQYKKNIGRKLLVTPNEGAEVLGTITDVTDEKIMLEVLVGKKKETVITEIPFTDIKEAVVQISF